MNKIIEISRTSRHFTEQTPYGPYEVRETVIIRKQTWNDNAGIYSGKSYELGSVLHNENLVNDWSKPWRSLS